MPAKNPSENIVVLDYSIYPDCHSNILVDIGKAMNGMDQSDLRFCELDALSDICRGPNELHISELLNSHRITPNEGYKTKQPANPQIGLKTHVSSAGNLCIEWFPLNTKDGRNFYGWSDPQFRTRAIGCRPSNELLYVRNFCGLGDITSDNTQLDVLRRLILEAGILLVAALVSRLRLTFEVVELQKLYAVCAVVEQHPRPRQVLVGWSIQTPRKFQENSEIDRLNQWQNKNGVSVQKAIEEFVYAMKKKGRGPAPTNLDRIDEKVAARLRLAGHEVSERQIRELRELLSKHDPGKLPEPLRKIKGALARNGQGEGHASSA